MIKSSAVLIVAAGRRRRLPARRGRRVSGRAFVTEAFSLTAADWTRIQSGRVMARTLNRVQKREVATLGVIRIKITPDFYVTKLDDIATFKRSEPVLQIGTFRHAAVDGRRAAMTLDDADIRELRGCRAQRLRRAAAGQAIARFRNEIDWRRSDARSAPPISPADARQVRHGLHEVGGRGIDALCRHRRPWTRRERARSAAKSRQRLEAFPRARPARPRLPRADRLRGSPM